MNDNFEARLRAERDRLMEKIDRASKIIAALDVLIAAYADNPSALEGPKVAPETPKVSFEPRPPRPPPKPAVRKEKPVDQVTYTPGRKEAIRSMIANRIPRAHMLKSLNEMPGQRIVSLGALNAQIKAMKLTGANSATPKPSIQETKPEVAAAPLPDDDKYPTNPTPNDGDYDPGRWSIPLSPAPQSVLTVRTADIVAWATQAGVTDPRNLFAVNKARLARGLPVYGPPTDARDENGKHP